MEAKDEGERGSRKAALPGCAVAPVLFDQDAADGKEIAQDADAAFGCRTMAGDGGHVSRPFTHGPEDIEIDAAFRAAVR